MDDVQVTQASDIEALYREAGDRLWWALLAYTGNAEAASDAGAEAFARALASAETIRDPSAWIWRVAFRVARSELRSARHATREPEGSYEIDHSAMTVLSTLGQLSPRQRAVIVLFYLEDRPIAEIATCLGMAPATVSVHLHRARTKLHTLLGDDDD